MKKLAILCLGLFLIGCDKPENSREIKDLKLDNVQSEKLEVVGGVGDLCGSAIEMLCGSGLECKLSENENTGMCVSTILNKDLECEKTQKPVCALKNDNKNAYLNACEAKRHGAIVLNNGMCEKNELIENSCDAKVLGLEGCGKIMKGVEFSNGKCVQKQVQGCDIERPFVNIETCEKTCLGGLKSKGVLNKETEKDEVIAELLKVCPEEFIVNKMPQVLDDLNSDVLISGNLEVNGYYILNGKRAEINEFDPEFLKTCENIDEIIVQ